LILVEKESIYKKERESVSPKTSSKKRLTPRRRKERRKDYCGPNVGVARDHL